MEGCIMIALQNTLVEVLEYKETDSRCHDGSKGKSLTTAVHILATAAKTKIARICVV
jgi:hypothetical protein